MSKKILVIEDDEFLQGLEARKFEKEGYKVLLADNAKQAFKHTEENNDIDLILLDLLLPEIDGFHILKMLKEDEKTKKIPVLVFSNLGEEKDIKQVNDLGVNDFLVKSNYTLDELVIKIKSLIG